jgi:hypothetical protein
MIESFSKGDKNYGFFMEKLIFKFISQVKFR